MIMIFNNIYFYLFLALFLIYNVLKKTLKITLLSKDKFISQLEFNVYLDKYLRNNNIFFTYFILLIYFIIAILPFFILRINRLGTSYDIHYINLEQIIMLFFFLLSFIYIFKILNLIIYEYILKMHYYLHHKYIKYHDFVEDNIFLKKNILHEYCTEIFCFFYRLTETNKEFIHLYKNIRDIYPRNEEILKEFKTEWLYYLYLRYFVKKYFFIKIVIKILKAIFSFLSFHISRFIYYIPYSLLFLTLTFDIIYGKFYYIFYALLYLYITNIIKKIRKFYYDKDPVYDNILSNYFYNNQNEYYKLKNAIENNDFSEIFKLQISNNAISDYINNKEGLIEYINSDFKVYYVTDITRANNEKYIMNNYKRLHVIMLLAFFNFYMVYYNKYTLVFSNMQINLGIISIIILCLIYYIHRQIAQELPTHWIENRRAKMCFRIIIFFYIIASLYLFLKNKFDPNFIEIIFSYKDIFCIKENFTINEKYAYLKYYIEHLKKDANFDNQILDQILEKINNKNSLIYTKTLEDIRNIVHEIYNQTKNLLVLETKKTIIEKIIGKFKSLYV